jgi:hypothetical protein
METLLTLSKNAITLFTLTIYSITTFAADYIDHDFVIWRNDRAEVSGVQNLDSRIYKMKTTALLRDSVPYNKSRMVLVDTDYPQVFSGSPLFDALYALGVEELKQNSVEEIVDHSFSRSQCHCFETGRKWNYVWTRDISYSAHLALAAFNQERTKNSLLFKISKQRNKSYKTTEVVQDTGTGGSWPVSTDRVVWALGAHELLQHMDGSERQEFLKTSYLALKNTVDSDRMAIYDNRDGLYTGEQSFLDWREQTYPKWVEKNIIHVGMSKALSTNILHFYALKKVADFAIELGHTDEFNKYTKMANALRKNINKHFWDKKQKLYTTFITTYLDRAPVNKYDLLGNSLAVLLDVAQTSDQKKVMQYYPMVKAGAPVVWPQDQEVAVYHNRGIWPFVTQYALLAAKKAGQAHIYNHLFDSMIRGAALNLSNMENFEFLTLGSWVDDGAYSGPVVNSQRQLWSVAGILSTYMDGVFGKEVVDGKIDFNPFITEKMRNTILKKVSRISLKDFKFKNQYYEVVIELPRNKVKYDEYAYYTIESKQVVGNKFMIQLGATKRSNERVKIYPQDDFRGLNSIEYEIFYAPKTPSLFPISDSNGHPKLYFETNSYRRVSTNVYRNGKLIARDVMGKTYIDYTADKNLTNCYVIATEFMSNGNRSQHSEPHCSWGKDAVKFYSVTNARQQQGQQSFTQDKEYTFIEGWGAPHQVIGFKTQKITKAGKYSIQLSYNNHGSINTGITSAVKKVEVFKEGKLVKSSVFMMPHHDLQYYWVDSNFIGVELEKGATYTFKISDFYNMSYFEHFNTYLYRGGRSGAYNYVNLAGLKLLYMGPQ